MPARLVVNEAYITDSNAQLKKTQQEIAPVRSGQNPTGRGASKSPAQPFDSVRLVAGAQTYTTGTDLTARVVAQGKAFSEQLTSRSTYLAKFVANVEIFLRDADEAENFNTMKAAEIAYLFPTS